jgi:putative oxidoreductase
MKTNRAVDASYFLLRVVAGWMFFQAGSMKVLAWWGGMPGQPGVTVPLTSQMGIGGLLEMVGGVAIMLGLFTRPIAFILSGEMAVAYWQFHAPNGTWPIQNNGQPAVLYCFLYLYMAAQGAGGWSLDALLGRQRGAAASAAVKAE